MKIAAALLAVLLPVAAHAQMARYQFAETPVVRDSLARAWNDSSAYQVERGYCLDYEAHQAPFGVIRVVLTKFVKPDSVWDATPYSIGFRCPDGTLDLHTHTPVTCPLVTAFDRDYKHCAVGGDDAWVCYPSGMDQLSLTARGTPVGFIQCSRHAILPYFPFPRAQPPSAAGTS